MYATEELEETAKLVSASVRGQQTKLLTSEQVAELHRKFPA